MSGTAFALIVYALLWGLVVEVTDRALGDPFEPLDVLTLARFFIDRFCRDLNKPQVYLSDEGAAALTE